MFHGSYNPDDVTFLLDPIRVTASGVEPDAPTGPGAPDYAQLIASEEPLPRAHQIGYLNAVELYSYRVALDTVRVARTLIKRSRSGNIVLASLVRAGTPIGVLLQRALKQLGVQSCHYSISATRKRGSDPAALDIILKRHQDHEIVFVDGWTGKGFIASELQQSICAYNATRGTNVDPALVVLADLAGVADVAASADDYLIPAAMLRSTVCGLISASMLNPRPGSSLPDACLFYEHLRGHDWSLHFVNQVSGYFRQAMADGTSGHDAVLDESKRREVAAVSNAFVDKMMHRYGLKDRNQVKPGICEAYRALLTRKVDLALMLRDDEVLTPDINCLLFLANSKGAMVITDPTCPYNAAVLLKN